MIAADTHSVVLDARGSIASPIAGWILLLAGGALYARLYTVVAFYGAVLAPTTGILLADWLVLRRGPVNVRALHHRAPGSAYGYIAGFNPAAMIVVDHDPARARRLSPRAGRAGRLDTRTADNLTQRKDHGDCSQ